MLNKVVLGSVGVGYQVILTGFIDYYSNIPVGFFSDFASEGLIRAFDFMPLENVSGSFTCASKELWFYSEHSEQTMHPIGLVLNGDSIPLEIGGWTLGNKDYRVRAKLALTQSKNTLSINVG